MVVGKTSSTISKGEIFNKVSEADILATYFDIKTIPCVICSPLREDKNPSFSIYLNDNNHIRYNDFATGEKGNLIDLLCRYWNCSFTQTIDRICQGLHGVSDVKFKPQKIKTFTRKEKDSLTKIQVAVRPWRDYDYEYWASYGITKKWLKYAEIYPISHKIITKKESPSSKEVKSTFGADKYAYCFVERKEGKMSLKIYQPFNKDGFKWCSKMDSSVVGLWTKIPQTGDRVVICSSMKDALCLSCQCEIPTLCLQGEGYGMSNTAINELKRRFKKVFICFDVDKAGIQDSHKLSERTGFINVIPDLNGQKDLSDYYKSLENKENFKLLEKLFK